MRVSESSLDPRKRCLYAMLVDQRQLNAYWQPKPTIGAFRHSLVPNLSVWVGSSTCSQSYSQRSNAAPPFTYVRRLLSKEVMPRRNLIVPVQLFLTLNLLNSSDPWEIRTFWSVFAMSPPSNSPSIPTTH